MRQGGEVHFEPSEAGDILVDDSGNALSLPGLAFPITSRVDEEEYDRWVVDANGKMGWSDGTGALRAFFEYDGTNDYLQFTNSWTDGYTGISGGSIDFVSDGNGTILWSRRDTDTHFKMRINADGDIRWGNGANGPDVMMLTRTGGLHMRSPDGTLYKLSTPPDGGGAPAWVAA